MYPPIPADKLTDADVATLQSLTRDRVLKRAEELREKIPKMSFKFLTSSELETIHNILFRRQGYDDD